MIHLQSLLNLLNEIRARKSQNKEDFITVTKKMEAETHSLGKTARLAGRLYLAMGITAAYAIMYVPSQIIVRGDAAATANNLITNEFLFRTGIVSHLISETLFVFWYWCCTDYSNR